MKAKQILLNKYILSPPPNVVELDHHPHGPEIQQALATLTGRATVPNVLINGKSIGGGDDVALLDAHGELIHTINKLGVGKVSKAELRPDVGHVQAGR
jgi:glutaredoxin